AVKILHLSKLGIARRPVQQFSVCPAESERTPQEFSRGPVKKFGAWHQRKGYKRIARFPARSAGNAPILQKIFGNIKSKLNRRYCGVLLP
ncbi:MAG: hypothetical protein LBL20_04575, partial [Treponema sp.]|nr:hypothetical protein [Treponema sp.]